MEFLNNVILWWNSNASILAGIFLALWGLSEALAAIPSVKANGVFQAIRNGLQFVLGKVFGKQV